MRESTIGAVRGAALVIAILAAAALVAGLFSNGEDEDKVNQVSRAYDALKVAEESYYEANGRYTEELSDLLAASPEEVYDVITRDTRFEFSLSGDGDVVTVQVRHVDDRYFAWFSLARGETFAFEEIRPGGSKGSIRTIPKPSAE